MVGAAVPMPTVELGASRDLVAAPKPIQAVLRIQILQSQMILGVARMATAQPVRAVNMAAAAPSMVRSCVEPLMCHETDGYI